MNQAKLAKKVNSAAISQQKYDKRMRNKSKDMFGSSEALGVLNSIDANTSATASVTSTTAEVVTKSSKVKKEQKNDEIIKKQYQRALTIEKEERGFRKAMLGFFAKFSEKKHREQMAMGKGMENKLGKLGIIPGLAEGIGKAKKSIWATLMGLGMLGALFGGLLTGNFNPFIKMFLNAIDPIRNLKFIGRKVEEFFTFWAELPEKVKKVADFLTDIPGWFKGFKLENLPKFLQGDGFFAKTGKKIVNVMNGLGNFLSDVPAWFGLFEQGSLAEVFQEGGKLEKVGEVITKGLNKFGYFLDGIAQSKIVKNIQNLDILGKVVKFLEPVTTNVTKFIDFMGGIGKGVMAGLKGAAGKGVLGMLGKGLKFLKRVPGLGMLISIPFAIMAFKDGDIVGGLLELASGMASLDVTGTLGMVIGIAIDSYLIFRSFKGQDYKEKEAAALKKVGKQVLYNIPVIGSVLNIMDGVKSWKADDKESAIKSFGRAYASIVPGGSMIFDVMYTVMDKMKKSATEFTQDKEKMATVKAVGTEVLRNIPVIGSVIRFKEAMTLWGTDKAGALRGMGGALASIMPGGGLMFDAIGGIIDWSMNKGSSIAGIVTDTVNNVKGFGADLFDPVVELFTTVFAKIQGFFEGIGAGIQKIKDNALVQWISEKLGVDVRSAPSSGNSPTFSTTTTTTAPAKKGFWPWQKSDGARVEQPKITPTKVGDASIKKQATPTKVGDASAGVKIKTPVKIGDASSKLIKSSASQAMGDVYSYKPYNPYNPTAQTAQTAGTNIPFRAGFAPTQAQAQAQANTTPASASVGEDVFDPSTLSPGMRSLYNIGKIFSDFGTSAATAMGAGVSGIYSSVMGAMGGGSGGGFRTGNPTGDNPIKNVLDFGGGWNIVERPNGDKEKQTGARNWRNNNPGNIEEGSFARKYGSLGGDDRFAIFPDYQTGRAAKEGLIFTTSSYRNKTLTQAISRYAPSSENNTGMYQRTVLQAVGGQDKKMSEYSPAERAAIMNAMERVEGFKVGSVISMGKTPQATQTASTTGSSWSMFDIDIADAASVDATNSNTAGIDPSVWNNFTGLASEYNGLTGQSVQLNSGYRGMEEQQQLYNTLPAGYAAAPGESLHNYGMALDIDPNTAISMSQMSSNGKSLLDRWGFTQPAPQKEPWHIQPKTVQSKPLSSNAAPIGDPVSNTNNNLPSQHMATKSVTKIQVVSLSDETIAKLLEGQAKIGKDNKQRITASSPAVNVNARG